jgi:hypothetical protein
VRFSDSSIIFSVSSALDMEERGFDHSYVYLFSNISCNFTMHVKIKDPDKLVDRHILVWLATNFRLYSVFLATKCSRRAFNIR